MCGIVGLYLKNPEIRDRLGAYFSPMLEQMSDRGPDSAGVAIYRDEVAQSAKVTLYDPDPNFNWTEVAADSTRDLGVDILVECISSHAILSGEIESATLRRWVEEKRPNIRVMSLGNNLEIYKEVGLPSDVLTRFGIPQISGSHAIGHTRMATESAVTTEGAHPFNTGDDLCLVHNGSLSNHHRLRDWLRDHAGFKFQTENDSEVAAAYLTWRLGQGATIAEALEAALLDLDGFYTFAVGTRDGFSVLRDPIACKPAVMAETDDWVAMASEFRALAQLPGVDAARVWEPEPATVYSWGQA
ncbi:MAG: glutamine amidotransferase family protein [Alphaproteobacteria bacterium]|nr:glutamine amidotransferase family protein [Alphaproteobacteria bacterium]